MKLIVALDGTGDFKTIQGALDSIPEDNEELVTIYIKKGIYREKVHIEKPYIRLIGEDERETKITFDDYARKIFTEGEEYGTFRSYTLFIGTHDITLEQLTIENSSGDGSIVGQALALYAEGDRLIFRNCHFLGRQDTIFTGPLPASPIKPGSFKGPRENEARINGRQYYEKCYIEGDVDFIFGSATAYFKECEIFSCNRNAKVNGYITAASTPEGQKYGYVFEGCKLTSDCRPDTVYLGRPWRDYAHTAFINCEMGSHIKKEGWHDWNKAHAQEVARYEEYHNTGLGADTQMRESWTKSLTEDEAKSYTLEQVLEGEDDWGKELV